MVSVRKVHDYRYVIFQYISISHRGKLIEQLDLCVSQEFTNTWLDQQSKWSGTYIFWFVSCIFEQWYWIIFPNIWSTYKEIDGIILILCGIYVTQWGNSGQNEWSVSFLKSPCSVNSRLYNFLQFSLISMVTTWNSRSLLTRASSKKRTRWINPSSACIYIYIYTYHWMAVLTVQLYFVLFGKAFCIIMW